MRAFCAIAADVSLSPAQLALAWCLHQDHVSSVITGATRVSQVTDNVVAADTTLDEETLARLQELF